MVTEFIRRILFKPAAWVLKKELGSLKDSLSAFAAEHYRMTGRMNHALGQYNEMRKVAYNLSKWAGSIAERSDGGETQSRMLFIRDMLDHGPNGPWNNTHGVHPADRWNIKSFKH